MLSLPGFVLGMLCVFPMYAFQFTGPYILSCSINAQVSLTLTLMQAQSHFGDLFLGSLL